MRRIRHEHVPRLQILLMEVHLILDGAEDKMIRDVDPPSGTAYSQAHGAKMYRNKRCIRNEISIWGK
jgi:hypothetical protein